MIICFYSHWLMSWSQLSQTGRANTPFFTCRSWLIVNSMSDSFISSLAFTRMFSMCR